MSFDSSMLGVGSYSPNSSEVKEPYSIIPDYFKSPKTSFSGYKSTKSMSEHTEGNDLEYFQKVEKELSQYKILLQN